MNHRQSQDDFQNPYQPPAAMSERKSEWMSTETELRNGMIIGVMVLCVILILLLPITQIVRADPQRLPEFLGSLYTLGFTFVAVLVTFIVFLHRKKFAMASTNGMRAVWEALLTAIKSLPNLVWDIFYTVRSSGWGLRPPKWRLSLKKLKVLGSHTELAVAFSVGGMVLAILLSVLIKYFAALPANVSQWKLSDISGTVVAGVGFNAVLVALIIFVAEKLLKKHAD